MKRGAHSLLIDNNLSVLLQEILAPHFEGTCHVSDIGQATASDAAVWELAKAEFAAILTKDRDFYYRVSIHGAPPKVIWITRGNCGNRELIALLKSRIDEMKAFLNSAQDLLIIS